MGLPSRRCRLASVWLVLVTTLLLAGCRMPGQDPDPGPSSPGATPRPFTVMSTDPVRVSDPAAMTDAASAMLAINVFQRLLTSDPGAAVLKPDAARDCGFIASPTIYTCTLNEGLTFQNGHALTSSDVKFSIERATRLNVAGSSASLLSSLRKIETPDPVTVRFVLSRADTQFGWALASPAASIVDEETYDADEVRSADEVPVGSGPFAVAPAGSSPAPSGSPEDRKTDPNLIELTRFAGYKGRTPAKLESLVYRTAADSATIEDAMDKGTVDVVWRGLNAPAVTRFAAQVQQNPSRLTTSGYTQGVLTGKRVLQIGWTPGSEARKNKALRQAIAVALQGDRTLDSVVPGGVPGHASTFPLGGKATPKVTWKNRIKLTLGYDSTEPNGRDIASQIRSRLEDTGGLSVQLRPDAADTDLALVDRKAWTPTALAWLQPYLDAPLNGSKSTVSAVENSFRATAPTDETQSVRLLGELQQQAALDQLILPISQSDEFVYARNGVDVDAGSFGPGWQLGLFGMSRG